MPRVTCFESDLLVSTLNGRDWQKGAPKADVESSAESREVFHRKSERRRVARDIFLVFEEQPRSRRTLGAKNKRQTKSKFGHLKVEGLSGPNKTKPLLRDIKNEPKCPINAACPKRQTKRKPTPKPNGQPQINKQNAGAVATGIQKPPANAPVNPIFLWVKQDDTRIVEVRCEDYDKRNRIRISKTTNGWRAIPRTDTSTSKIVKFFQTSSSSAAVKHEAYDDHGFEYDVACEHDEVTGDHSNSPLEPKMCLVSSNTNNNTLSCPSLPEAINQTSECPDTNANSEPLEAETKKTLPSISCDSPNEQKQPEIEASGDFDANGVPDLTEESLDHDKSNDYDKDDRIAATYHCYEETETNSASELHLCPKTGLFLPNIRNVDTPSGNATRDFLDHIVSCEIDELQCNSESQSENQIETQNIDDDDETKRLKDLLDDADLLQHCGDNISSGTEVIDSLVKRSCEDNFVQQPEVLQAAQAPVPTSIVALSADDLALASVESPKLSSVSDSPKCLSFNEAGEIEGMNGELFHSNSFIDTFTKNASEIVQLSTEAPNTTPPQPNHAQDYPEAFEKDQTDRLLSKIHEMNATTSVADIDANVPLIRSSITDTEHLLEEIMVDTPKDLSFKNAKNDDISPRSETHSQCAVTSSSDVVQTQRQDQNQHQIPAIESTSETIKSLILEQIMKLNSIGSIATTSQTLASKPLQSEPMDLGKCQIEPSREQESRSIVPTTNYIDTVVIDDNSDEEPTRKRLRNTMAAAVVAFDEKASLIDKDPDPLTQLQLLVKNTQWKVPDPILVPKDRLAAVLASPAREIPLLITTRPELRLPEAFAYPEIIQNPNILVISMAQLESILKNEMDVEKCKSQRELQEEADTGVEVLPLHVQLQENSSNTTKLKQNHSNEVLKSKTLQAKEVEASDAKCGVHLESNLASDINAATLAVLNQMLWFPYFSQLSQEYLKSLKGPLGPLQGKSNLLSLNNQQQHQQQQQFGLEELYKNYMKQSSPKYPISSAMGAFENPVELALFHKIVQHQMHNFLDASSLSTNNSSAKETTSQQQAQPSLSGEQITKATHSNGLEPKKCRKLIVDTKTETAMATSGKMNCLKNMKANYDSTLSAQATPASRSADIQKQCTIATADSKPKITCKSLSNLLGPDRATDAAPLINLSTESHRSTQEYGAHSDKKESSCAPIAQATYKSAVRPLKPHLNGALNTYELSKHRKRNSNILDPEVNGTALRGTEALMADTNSDLWHPLFGSNATKMDYGSSPWHWATVTATGE